MQTWPVIKCLKSSDENVLKYVFTNDNAIAEAVLYKYGTYEERTVVCCSTQSGCPVGCRFCGAGDYFVRSLTSTEIVSQVEHLLADIDSKAIKRFQIMFMSMGEPLLNFPNLAAAIKRLYYQYKHAALLISTSAPRVNYSPVIALSNEVPTVGLQFSIHESTDEARNRLIPFKDKLTLEEIANEGNIWHMETGRRPFFNYCAHPANTSQEDAERLFRLFSPGVWNATISVICERDESIAAANERQQELAANFQQKLSALGYNTRMFNPAGQDDIGGGCGQLWYVQEWMKGTSLARPSIGHGLEKVHTPV